MIAYMIHPKHGKMPVYDYQMIEYNRKFGWELEDKTRQEAKVIQTVEGGDVTKTSEETEEENGDINHEAAVTAYFDKFGKYPHHRMKTETILKALNEHGA